MHTRHGKRAPAQRLLCPCLVMRRAVHPSERRRAGVVIRHGHAATPDPHVVMQTREESWDTDRFCSFSKPDHTSVS